jgi:hypothetical protein
VSPFFCVRVTDAGFQVGITTDGRDFVPIPRAAFGKPRDAVRYAELRQQAVSPLRVSVEDVGSPPLTSSVEPLTRLGK